MTGVLIRGEKERVRQQGKDHMRTQLKKKSGHIQVKERSLRRN